MSELLHLAGANAALPISKAVGIAPTAYFYQLGAQFPEATDSSAPPRSIQAFGNTYTQTATTLRRLASILKDLGLNKRNLTNMRVYLVAENAGEAMKLDEFNKAYAEFFSDQPDGFPSRTVLQVVALANPGWLIEIEATAAAASATS